MKRPSLIPANRSSEGRQTFARAGFKPLRSQTPQNSLFQPLGSLAVRPPVTCRAQTPLREALELMHRENVGAIVIATAEGAPEGIFTERDLLRIAAAGSFDAAAPIARFMMEKPIGLPASATAYDAALVMARHRMRHVLVVEHGVLKGVVSERTLFAHQRRSMRHVIHAVERAHDLAGLKRASSGILEYGHALLAEGIASEHLTRIIATLNDHLAERIVMLEAERHDLSRLRWCWLALGSEGRHEQTFNTDQDNAIVFEAASGQADDAARALLLPFGRAVNETLDACGFPLCPGNIMAGNPECCLSTGEWRERFDGWVRDPAPEALLKASIFFDFRPIAGESGLADGLRSWLRDRAKGSERFLKVLALNALETEVPLGFFGNLLTGGKGADAGTLDLKIQGTRVITDAARIYALASGVDETNTGARLRGAGDALGVAAAEVEAVAEAFYHLLHFRLKNQLESGGAPNRLAPGKLNEFDRRVLKESLRQARRLQQRLALDYRR
jgi:CBS domain-containing protein